MTVVVTGVIITCNSYRGKSWKEIKRGLSNEVDDDDDKEEEEEEEVYKKWEGEGFKKTVDTATGHIISFDYGKVKTICAIQLSIST